MLFYIYFVNTVEKMKRMMSNEIVSSNKTKKDGLGWMVWLRGWVNVLQEILLQRIMASHLHNPFPLPPLNNLTCIVTGSTSGIGSETARYQIQNKALFIILSYCFLFSFAVLEKISVIRFTLHLSGEVAGSLQRRVLMLLWR